MRKPLTEEQREKARQRALRNYCRQTEEQRQQRRERDLIRYYAQHEKYLEKGRVWRDANREHLREINRRAEAKRPPRSAEYSVRRRAYYKLQAQSPEYRERRRERDRLRHNKSRSRPYAPRVVRTAEESKERKRLTTALWRFNHPERWAELMERYRLRNADRIIQKHRDHSVKRRAALQLLKEMQIMDAPSRPPPKMTATKKASCKAWRENNRGEYRAIARRGYRKNREKILTENATYRLKQKAALQLLQELGVQL